MTTRTPPQHGERRCYLRGCRRAECREAHYRYMSRWRLDNQSGQRRRTPATPATSHVTQLLAAGWAINQIADAARCGHRTIGPIARGQQPTITPRTERLILNIPIAPPPPSQYVDPTGTARRIRALVAIGHPLSRIGPAVGISTDAAARIARGDHPTVRGATAAAVADLYRRWAGKPGTSNRARAHAARHGWHSPLAWNNIDDPNATPETDPGIATQVDRIAEAAHLAEEVQHLAQFGIAVPEIARRVGRSESYVREQLAGRRGPGWRDAQRQAESEAA